MHNNCKMKYSYSFPMTQHEKWVLSLRVCYRAGYTRYFDQHVQEYRAKGLSAQEMIDSCIDEPMKQQIMKCFDQMEVDT